MEIVGSELLTLATPTLIQPRAQVQIHSPYIRRFHASQLSSLHDNVLTWYNSHCIPTIPPNHPLHVFRPFRAEDRIITFYSRMHSTQV
jgi:hypothetical protein